MSDKNDGGPAFPTDGKNEYPVGNNGMSLRDYFAAKAMHGLIVNLDGLINYFNESEITTRDEMAEKISEIAFDFADAMIKESQKS